MPGRTRADRVVGRTEYPVSLLQAAAALYGRDAAEELDQAISQARKDPKARRTPGG